VPNLTKGSFSLNFGLIQLGGELADDDRQCAWELYTELSTRVAVTGKSSDPECIDFSGELYIESLESFYRFFQEARLIMRKFPVGRISPSQKDHLGIVINRMMTNVLRPFLEKWQADYRHWWEQESNPRLALFRRQSEFPRLQELLTDWADARWLMREVQKELVNVYKLVDINK
jgi:hypothetical protein